MVLSNFFLGRMTHTVLEILDTWICHLYGRPYKDSLEMFSGIKTASFLGIWPVQPVMTSFALQNVTEKLVHDAKHAVSPAGGLHVHIPSKKQPVKSHVKVVDWKDLGSQTQAAISQIHQRHQGTLRYLLKKVALRLNHQNVNRPTDLMCIHIMLLQSYDAHVAPDHG